MSKLVICAGSLLAIMLTAPPVSAQVRKLCVMPPFADAKEAMNLSGAACAIDATKTCLLVADEVEKTRTVQSARTFTIAGDILRPGTEVPLLDGSVETDAEAVAYAGGYYYLAGSHGLSKKDSVFQPSRFLLYRIKADPNTGAPVGKAARTAKLRAILAATAPFSTYAEKPLADHGVNIEGIAARDGHLFLAFRGPAVDGRAWVLRVAINAVFGASTEKPVAFPIAAPAGIGLRDIAVVGGGFLLLTGPEADTTGPADIRFWDGKADRTTGTVAVTHGPDAKPEGLMLVAEHPASYEILLLSDGAAGGDPTVMTVLKSDLGVKP